MKKVVLIAVGEIAVMTAFFVLVGYFGNHQPAHPALAVEPTVSIQATVVAYLLAAGVTSGMYLFGWGVWNVLKKTDKR